MAVCGGLPELVSITGSTWFDALGVAGAAAFGARSQPADVGTAVGGDNFKADLGELGSVDFPDKTVMGRRFREKYGHLQT